MIYTNRNHDYKIISFIYVTFIVSTFFNYIIFKLDIFGLPIFFTQERVGKIIISFILLSLEQCT